MFSINKSHLFHMICAHTWNIGLISIFSWSHFNLPISLGQIAIEIAASDKVHVINEVICCCSETSKIENYAHCSDEVNSAENIFFRDFNKKSHFCPKLTQYMIFAAPSLPSVSPILEILREHSFSPRFFPSFLSVPLKFLLQQLDWFQMYVFCGFLKEINSRKIFWFKNFSGSNN